MDQVPHTQALSLCLSILQLLSSLKQERRHVISESCDNSNMQIFHSNSSTGETNSQYFFLWSVVSSYRDSEERERVTGRDLQQSAYNVMHCLCYFYFYYMYKSSMFVVDEVTSQLVASQYSCMQLASCCVGNYHLSSCVTHSPSLYQQTISQAFSFISLSLSLSLSLSRYEETTLHRKKY